MKTDPELSPGMVLVSGEIVKQEEPDKFRLVLPDGNVRRPRHPAAHDRPAPGLRGGPGRPQREPVPRRSPPGSRRRAPAASSADYEVSDMGSTNGTKVNGMPVVGAQLLRDGDQITVGATAIRFERG